MYSGLQADRAGSASCNTSATHARQMVRLVLAVMLAMTALAGVVGLASHQASAGQAATVVADGVGLMAGVDDPSVIAVMYAGERVDVLSGPHNGSIYEIYYYGIHGYAWAEHLSLDTGGELYGGTGGSGGGWAAAGSALVNTDFLNVRGDASLSASIWDVFAGGTAVDVVGQAVNGFVPINYNGSQAWVAAEFLSWDGTVNFQASQASEPAPDPGPERWIDINRSSGMVTLMVGDAPQASYYASLGYDPSDSGFYSTAVGTYYVYWKELGLTYTPYADAYISHWIGFDSSRDNGFHSYTKDANGNILPNGAGKTGGCVALAPGEIDVVFDFAAVGMRIEIHN